MQYIYFSIKYLCGAHADSSKTNIHPSLFEKKPSPITKRNGKGTPEQAISSLIVSKDQIFILSVPGWLEMPIEMKKWEDYV